MDSNGQQTAQFIKYFFEIVHLNLKPLRKPVLPLFVILAICVLLLGSIFSSTAADLQFKNAKPAIDQTWITVPVSSKAFMFSPGNWTGSKGRSGDNFRQTWNPGAYFCVAWETKNTRSFARILFDTCGYSPGFVPIIA
jgi:hypothetical protein